jgi:NitT/TauT family transport system substrate-binding protein
MRPCDGKNCNDAARRQRSRKNSVDSLFIRAVASGCRGKDGLSKRLQSERGGRFIPVVPLQLENAFMTPSSNKTRSRVLVALAMLIVLISTPAHAQAPRKVKMTLPVVALTTAPVYLAEAKGYFAQEGLSVELNVTGGGGPDIKALIAGDVDFTYTASDQVILPWQEGKRLMMVMGVIPRALINWAMHKDVAQAKGITEKSPLVDKLKALRGLTIGSTQPGSLTANLAAYTLRKAGLVPQQDANVIPVGSGLTWLAALEQRKVDVALMSPPLPDTAVARGFAILLIDNARGEDPALAEFLQQVFVTRPDVIQKDPELVRKLVRALLRANQWALAAKPEEIADALQPSMGATPRDALLTGIKATVPAYSRDGRITERALKAAADVMEVAGILKKRPTLADVATNDFLPK